MIENNKTFATLQPGSALRGETDYSVDASDDAFKKSALTDINPD